MRRRNGSRCAPTAIYAENGIELRLGTKATGIDKRGRAVELADGTKLGL